jgi:LacI family transcriptional regulator
MSTSVSGLARRRGDSVTMSDIARRAEVSRPTVSIVLNGRHEDIGIAEETRQRVLQAARELGYRRNALARAVKTGRSLTLGFLAGDADIEYSSRAFSGILDEAEEQDYTVKRFRLHDRASDDKVIERCSEHRLDGVIVNDTGLGVATDLIRREFEVQSVPVVWLDPKGPQSWGVQVRPDDEQGTVTAVQHLVELGHRRIAFVGGIENVGTGVTRGNGFLRGMAEANLDASLVRWTQWQSERILAILDELLALDAPPTAFLCGSDATVFLRRLRALGHRVPQDVSVLGFGDLARVELADPALSTIRVPYGEMGRESVRQVLAMLQAPEQSSQHKETLFATELVLRESTGVVPAAS